MNSTRTESLTVDGDRAEWLDRIAEALAAPPWRRCTVDRNLWRAQADYRSATRHGSLSVTLHPVGSSTRLDVTVTARMDNIYAIFQNPKGKILEEFRAKISPQTVGPAS